MIGRLADAVTETLDVCAGTRYNGGTPTSGSERPVSGGIRGASVTTALVFSRGSTKKSAAAAPLLVIFTVTLTGWPAVSLVLALLGSPVALALAWLNRMFPVYGWDTSLPTTGSAKSTISVQIPGTGFSA